MLQKQLNEREMYHLLTTRIMTNNYAILLSLGFCKEDYKFENFKSDFGYDWTSEDLDDAIESAGFDIRNVRNSLMDILWFKVVYEYVDNKGCDREDFDCYVNGSLDTHFYFKETEVNSTEDIEELLERENEISHRQVFNA